MKKLTLIILAVISMMTQAQTKIYLTVGNNTRTATLSETAAAKELKEILESGSITIQMNDYGGFEKVGSLGFCLPANDTRITASAGDIMLYTGNQMVIFYNSNTWSYTPLARIDNATSYNIREFLGNGPVSVKVSLNNNSGAETIVEDAQATGRINDLNGNLITDKNLSKGIYIINGKKILIK